MKQELNFLYQAYRGDDGRIYVRKIDFFGIQDPKKSKGNAPDASRINIQLDADVQTSTTTEGDE